MATLADNIASPWLCVRPPECRAEVSSLEARRMLAKLGELHRPAPPRPAKNPGAAWGSTCVDGSKPCSSSPQAYRLLSAFSPRRVLPRFVNPRIRSKLPGFSI
jgi:hypothetical protein